MRITIVGPAYPLRGGIAHHVYWLKQALSAHGHSVQVISFCKLYPDFFFPGTTEIDSSQLKLDAGAVPILTPLNPVTWMKAFIKIKAFAPDAVIFQWWQPFFGPVVGTLAGLLRRVGARCIIECHNVFPHERTPFDRLLLKAAFLPVDYFITHSVKDKKDLLSITRAKVIKVSSLPALDEFSDPAGRARNGRTILFFGKVRKYKGLSVLIDAMPKVLTQIECQLIIAGEFYDPIDKYNRLIQKYDLQRHVHISNTYVANEEVRRLFGQADVLVLPYVSATQSGVAQIAFSNALPIIASRAGGLSEVVTENVNGLLFPAGDSNAFADQIISYFTNDLGPVFAKNLSASSNGGGGKLDEVIEEILKGS